MMVYMTSWLDTEFVEFANGDHVGRSSCRMSGRAAVTTIASRAQRSGLLIVNLQDEQLLRAGLGADSDVYGTLALGHAPPGRSER